MFKIVKREPEKELSLWEQFFGDSMFTDLFDTGFRYPAVDIYEKDGKVHIDAEVPGIKKENLKVEINDGILTISGEIKEEKEDKDKKYYRTERRYGTFQRSFTLGENIDEDSIDAKFENGILHITLPIRKEEKKENVKTIEIK